MLAYEALPLLTAKWAKNSHSHRQCIMKERPASEGRGWMGRRLRCAVQGFAPPRRR